MITETGSGHTNDFQPIQHRHILDTATPGRAQAIAEAGRHRVSLTTDQLQTITGILSIRMQKCDERIHSDYVSAEGVAYWQHEKAKADALRELLRAAL